MPMIEKMHQGRASHPGEIMVSGDCQTAVSGELCSAHGIKFPTPDPMARGKGAGRYFIKPQFLLK
jgi:hypothetical protein